MPPERAERRFVWIFTLTYLGVGLVVVTIAHLRIGPIADILADPIPVLLQVPVWPVFLPGYISGSYGA